ncbi:MAG: SBBP repeat-containing protein [Armatimonadota bacterium]|nr:SBBP repeat-containing protein [Armatimonadota bacterium]
MRTLTLGLAVILCAATHTSASMDERPDLPLVFIECGEQPDGHAAFAVQGPRGWAFFTNGGFALHLTAGGDSSPLLDLPARAGTSTARRTHPQANPFCSFDSRQSAALRVTFVDSQDAVVEGWNQLPGKLNYLIGSQPLTWKTNVPTFGGVIYRGVWPGVDVVYRGEDRRLKYDVYVSPGADLRRIGFRYKGVSGLELARDGALLIHTAIGMLREARPQVYQEKNGERTWLDSSFVIHGETVGFEVEDRDPSLPLVIDPATDLVWSTFLGGSGDDSGVAGVALDSSGNVYLAGWTTSTNFPTTGGAYDTSQNGSYDAFVAKLNASGSSLVYATFIGGSSSEGAYAIALDSSVCVYITGGTSSSDYPITTAAYDKTYNGNVDVFVSKLSADGSSLLASTFLGGSVATESPSGLRLDSSGGAYVAGSTNSFDFPTTSGAYDTTWNTAYDPLNNPLTDVFVTKLASDLSSLSYSTFLGGANTVGPYTESAFDIAVDSSGCAYVVGDTCSTDFPTTTGALRTSHNGAYDSFVTKLNASGSSLAYSTFLGGMTGRTEAVGVTVDSSGLAYVTGRTQALDYPTTSGSYQPARTGSSNIILTKINPSGSGVVDSTLFGGSVNADCGYAVALDSSGYVYLTGKASSTNFPATIDAYDPTCDGDDAYVAKFNASLSTLLYSTLLGGTALNGESALGIVVDSSGNAYVAGGTTSSDFPTTTGTYDTSYNGGTVDAFASKIQFPSIASISSVKQLADNSSVQRCSGIVTFFNGSWMYIESEDRSCGIRVDCPPGYTFSLGARVDAAGSIKTNTISGERYIDTAGVSRPLLQNGTGSVAPFTLANSAVGGADWNYVSGTGAGQQGIKNGTGLNNIGLLISTTGNVTGVRTPDPTEDCFYVDDGSGVVDASGIIGVKVTATGLTLPSVGYYVQVTGVSSCYKNGSDLHSVIRVRAQSDIVRLR